MRQYVNLAHALPPKEKKVFPVRQMKLGWIATAVILVFVTFIIWLWGFTLNARLVLLEKEKLKVTIELESLQIKYPGAFGKDDSGKVGSIIQDLENRKSLLAILKTRYPTNISGFSQYLMALSDASVYGAWLTDITIREAGNIILLRGSAFESGMAIALLHKINEQPIFQKRPLSLRNIKESASSGKSVNTSETQRIYNFEFATQGAEEEDFSD
ncbi:MAG: hypothetical protein ACE365_02705 [Gammaproteobacteria bacterium]